MCIPELGLQAINAIGLLIDDRDQKKIQIVNYETILSLYIIKKDPLK